MLCQSFLRKGRFLYKSNGCDWLFMSKKPQKGTKILFCRIDLSDSLIGSNTTWTTLDYTLEHNYLGGKIHQSKTGNVIWKINTHVLFRHKSPAYIQVLLQMTVKMVIKDFTVSIYCNLNMKWISMIFNRDCMVTNRKRTLK